MGWGILRTDIPGYLAGNLLTFETLNYQDTEYLGQKFTGYGILRPPPPQKKGGLLHVVFMWIFFSSLQVWEFVHDIIYNLHFQSKTWW